MTLTALIKDLFEKSEFDTRYKLFKEINDYHEVKVTKPTLKVFLEGTKELRKQEDLIFELISEDYDIIIKPKRKNSKNTFTKTFGS